MINTNHIEDIQAEIKRTMETIEVYKTTGTGVDIVETRLKALVNNVIMIYQNAMTDTRMEIKQALK